MNSLQQFFPHDFIWGTGVSAYQVEGAHTKYGKGLSIWDEFAQTKGKIKKSEHAEIACDFYHRYEEDLLLLKGLGIKNFRFSLAWTRILPFGTEDINPEGIDFYNRVINRCLELEITPWITLYHWDLPIVLEEKGGWTNREIISWFSEYVEVCAKHFGDRVKNWMVMNEPLAFTGAGYFLGIHAPGKKGLRNFLPAAHHATICQAEGGRILRKFLPDAHIGTTISFSSIDPLNDSEKDKKAAKRADVIYNRLFIEPLLGLGYPSNDLKLIAKIEKYIQPGDEKLLAFDFDFIGVQTYTREVVKHAWYVPFIKASLVKAEKRNVPRTAMGWEIYPESIYAILKKLGSYPNIPKLIVTENGAAFNDTVSDGVVADDYRIHFLKNHIAQVARARKEGVQVEGYFVWSFLDNFEWAEGYDPRFGLVYVDFETQERVVKNSGKWYGEFVGR